MIQRDKYYCTRSGERVGPMKKVAGGYVGYLPERLVNVGLNYHPDGRRAILNQTKDDIVGPWEENQPAKGKGGWVSVGLSLNGVGFEFGQNSFYTEILCRDLAAKNALALVQFDFVDGELAIVQQVPF